MYLVRKPNVCFTGVNNNYNLAATENTTPDLTMKKGRESNKVSHGGNKNIPRSICMYHISSFVPQPSVRLVARQMAAQLR